MTIHRFDTVDSTQHIAKQLARDGCAHGTMVLARRQTAGRGRLQRAWLSIDHALLCSVVLRPGVAMRLAPRLPLVVCARLLDVVDTLGVQLCCKWPNDLMMHADTEAPRLGPFRKVGGVLVEAVEVGDTIGCCVVGIGINVRGAIPEELVDIAGTLALAGYQGDVDTLAERVHQAMPTVPSGMNDAAFAQVRALLAGRSATIGRRIAVDDVRGVAEGIDDDGALVLRGDDGARQVVRAGDAWVDETEGPKSRS